MSSIAPAKNTLSKGIGPRRVSVGPVGPGGSSTTPSVASRFSSGQQPRRCSQGERTQGAIGEGLSGPGGASATPPAIPLTSLDLPCRNTQGSVSSRVRFFEGEERGPAGGGTATLPVDPSTPKEP